MVYRVLTLLENSGNLDSLKIPGILRVLEKLLDCGILPMTYGNFIELMVPFKSAIIAFCVAVYCILYFIMKTNVKTNIELKYHT
jgi:hypothetical protein